MVSKVIVDNEPNFGVVCQRGSDLQGEQNREVEITCVVCERLIEMTTWQKSDFQQTFMTSKEGFDIFMVLFGAGWHSITNNHRCVDDVRIHGQLSQINRVYTLQLVMKFPTTMVLLLSAKTPYIQCHLHKDYLLTAKLKHQSHILSQECIILPHSF